MELLEYKSDLRWVEDKLRVNYYYNLYQYKFWACIPYIHFFRYVRDEYQFNKRLDQLAPSYYHYRLSKWDDHAKSLQDLIEESGNKSYIQIIKNFINWRNIEIKQLKCKAKISHNTIEIYSNDSTIFNSFLQFEKIISHKRLYYVKQIKNFSTEVIYQKNPKNKYRLYFHLHRFDSETTKSFIKFLLTHDFSLSPSLTSCIHDFLELKSVRRRSNFYVNKGNGLTLSTHYYIDFDDEKLLTLLSLFESSIIRRVYRIEKR